jgi:hypothetical protein
VHFKVPVEAHSCNHGLQMYRVATYATGTEQLLALLKFAWMRFKTLHAAVLPLDL